jgi:hypothetical protein
VDGFIAIRYHDQLAADPVFLKGFAHQSRIRLVVLNQ